MGAREHKRKVFGSFGNFITGDIAIDDISFTEGACPSTSCPDMVPVRVRHVQIGYLSETSAVVIIKNNNTFDS